MNQQSRTDWDTLFMTMAFSMAMRSLDPRTKCGTILVGSDNTILSGGYNSLPRNCKDDEFDLTSDVKYLILPHSEDNAIALASKNGTKLDGCTAYITGPPCLVCLGRLININCKRIVYGPICHSGFKTEPKGMREKLLEGKNIQIEEYPHVDKIKDHFDKILDYISQKMANEKGS